ncbi:Gfo/Idh/MocA family oxidoreductase [Acidobacteria bacterium AH-259-D05]|nr:Gfo/Idh/MocA family oxidoreductase [Acidobacteria bacterium AH-259-D05]
MPSRTIRFGILGYGRFAERRVLPTIENSDFAELVAVQLRSRQFHGAKRGVRICSSAEELLADKQIHAIYLTSPNNLHATHTCQALEAGKHVLCEKPMACTPDECASMIQAAKRNGRFLTVGHMLRFSPALTRVRELIREGAIGEVVHGHAEFSYVADLSLRSWLLDRYVAGGGVLLDAGIHCIDALRFLIEGEVCEIGSHLQLDSEESGVERTAVCSMVFQNGIVGVVMTSSQASYGSDLEIVGTLGRVRIPGFTRCSGKLLIHLSRDSRMDATSSTLEISVDSTYTSQIEAFCESILSGSINLESAENGMKNVEIVAACYQQEELSEKMKS